MTVRISSLWRLCPLVYLLSLTPAWAREAEASLRGDFNQAKARVESDHTEQIDSLLSFYDAYLERQAAETQARGELDPLLEILAERKTVQESGGPGTDPLPETAARARQTLREKLAGLEAERNAALIRLHDTYLTQLEARTAQAVSAGRMKDVARLGEEAESIEQSLQALRPEPSEPEAPSVRLGPNLLAGGSFDREDDDKRWRIHAPRRSRTGLYRVKDSGSNNTLRFEQSHPHPLAAQHHLNLKDGTRYRIQWRTRMLRSWKPDIALRGKGWYRVGLHIPPHRWNALPPAEQARLEKYTARTFTPPPDETWQTLHVDLTTGPWMDMLQFSVSPGEGEFLIDDVEVREILPDPAPKPDA